jgi:hypothetical protein
VLAVLRQRHALGVEIGFDEFEHGFVYKRVRATGASSCPIPAGSFRRVGA